MRYRLRTLLIVNALLAASLGAMVEIRDRWYVYPERAAVHTRQKRTLLARATMAEQDAALCRDRAEVCRWWVVISAREAGAGEPDTFQGGWQGRVAEWDRLAVRCARQAAEHRRQAAEHARWERYYCGGR